MTLSQLKKEILAESDEVYVGATKETIKLYMSSALLRTAEATAQALEIEKKDEWNIQDEFIQTHADFNVAISQQKVKAKKWLES